MTVPDPFVAATCDCTDLDGFMLNVERLLASELVAIGTPEECWAALMLWCRAWKQIPAGSLPNDERILASFSGAGRRWAKVRGVALHGFVLCTDGRLYHRFLCAEASRAYARKLAFQGKRETDRKRLSKWREDRGGTETEWIRMREAVFGRDGRACTACGAKDDLHCDHVIPAADGGASEMHNLTTLCRGCHSRKSAVQRRGEMHFTRHVVAEGQGQKKKKEGSDSPLRSESAATAPVDPVKELFDRGVAIFVGAGLAAAKAREIIGKGRKEFGDVMVMAAISTCERDRPSEPVSYFSACLSGNRRRHGVDDGAGFGSPGFA